MGYYIDLLMKKINGKGQDWERRKITVLICGRCGEIDRETTIKHDGRCTRCGLNYTGCMQ